MLFEEGAHTTGDRGVRAFVLKKPGGRERKHGLAKGGPEGGKEYLEKRGSNGGIDPVRNGKLFTTGGLP